MILFDYAAFAASNDALRLVVERGVARRRVVEENRRLRESLSPQIGLDTIIGKSAAMGSREPARS